MLGSCSLTTFILTADAQRAKMFYSETLGLRFVKQDEYALVFDANGIVLRITSLPNHTPSEHPVLGWEVPDIAQTAAALAAAGVAIERYSFIEQDELGVWTGPGGSPKLAWFKDPDGNILSIAQH